MDIAALQAFVAVADARSFSVAAERIFITQPAISKRIATLETELGAHLFDRIGRKIQLTEAGISLLARARTIMVEVEDARRAITNLTGEIGGSLKMATSHHIGLHRLPPALKRFHESHPEVRLDLRFMDSEAAATAVAHGEIELAVVTLPERAQAALEVEKVWDDPLFIVVGRDHPLAQEKSVSPMMLLNHPAILPGPGTVTRERVLTALGSLAEGMQYGISTNYMEVLKTLTAIGLGWSALPQTLIDDSLAVVHIESINITRSLGILRHPKRTLSNAGQRMIEAIRNQE